MESFAQLLKRCRERAGLSQRALAARSGINVAIVNRIEGGERGPSGPEQVLAMCKALDLGEEETDLMLAAAGFWPGSLLRLGPADRTLLDVGRVLTAATIGDAAKRRFREVVALLAEQWLTGGSPPAT